MEIKEYVERVQKASKDMGKIFDDFQKKIYETSKEFRGFAAHLSRSSAYRWRMQNKNGRNKKERMRDQTKLRGHRRNRRN